MINHNRLLLLYICDSERIIKTKLVDNDRSSINVYPWYWRRSINEKWEELFIDRGRSLATTK